MEFSDICDQHDIDHPGPDNDFFREVLESFETDFFDETAKHHCMAVLKAKHHCMAVLNEALKIVLEYFTDDLPEVGEVDRTDPFSVFRILKKVNNNYLNWAKQNNFQRSSKRLERW